MRALDLFCGAGGITKGLQRAGFHVTGVDIKPQPRYCGDVFIQGDALEADLSGYDLVCASPPCQAFTAGRLIWKGRLPDDRHPELIEPVHQKLIAWGGPYIIENVERAPLINPLRLCGLSFGLGVKRHRIFESNLFLMGLPCPPGHPGEWISVFGGGGLSRTPKGGQARINGKHNGRGANDGRVHVAHSLASIAMGIDWMTRDELSESVPPAYSEFLGRQVMAILSR